MLNLSKSKYCNAYQCPKMLWLKAFMPEVFDDSVLNEAVLETGNEVGDLAMGLFGEFTEVTEHKEDGSIDNSKMLIRTKEELEKGTKIICEASFSVDGLFCSVDILKNNGNGNVEIYEVKSSTEVKEIYIQDVSYQNYVLEKAGLNVEKAFIVYINNEYVRHGDLDLNQLFNISELTSLVKANREMVESNIEFFRKYMEQTSEPEALLGEQCFKPYDCGFFKYCSKELPKNNIFDVARLTTAKKIKLLREGYVSFNDLLNCDMLNETQRMQVEFEALDKEDYIDKDAIQEFLDTLSYPMYFLDFETFQSAIPLYDDSKPYEQITFQYSLHYILEEGGKVYHKEFLAYPNEDPRRKLAERLVEDIPNDVCVLAYNMGFEKGRIKTLAEIYPDLATDLMNIHSNIKDLMIPFQKKNYYTRSMQGSYSIKYVLPALFPNDPSLDYHNLTGVHKGDEASKTFKDMAKMDKETLEEWRGYLLKYCELDTFAMVKVFEKMLEVTK